MNKKYTRLKNTVLGRSYDLSLVFIDKTKSRKLNQIYRKKNKPTNVLSFPISEEMGEIFIDRETSRRETGKFGMTFEEFIDFLFIHGLLHLKGMQHSDKMEKAEKKLLYGTTNSSRHRHRNLRS